MLAKYTAAQVTGLALVVLTFVIFLAWVLRRRVTFFQRLYIPTAVIGGFLMLLLGPQVLGALTNSQGASSRTGSSTSGVCSPAS